MPLLRPSLQRVERTLQNRRAESVRVRFLPHGDEMLLPAGTSARLVVTGPAGGELEVTRGGSLWTVYPWPGASVRVLRRREIVKELATAPRLPDGMTTRSWCEAMERDVLDDASTAAR